MKKVFLLLFLVFQYPIYSQEFKVDYFFGENHVNDIKLIDNNIWVGGYLGLTRINNTFYSDTEFIIDPFVDAGVESCFNVMVDADSENNLIIHNVSKLFSFENGNFEVLDSNLYISNLTIDEFDTKWFLNGSNEIIKIQNGIKTIFNPGNSSLPDVYYSCISTHNEILWLGTSYDGIVKFDNGEVTLYNTSNSELPYNLIASIEIDNEGNIWVACYTLEVHPTYDSDYTLVKIVGENWTIYNESNSGLPDTEITRILSNQEDIYLCTTDGLILFNGVGWTIYNQANSDIISDNVLTVEFDEQDLWIGTDEAVSLISNNSTINFEIANTTLSGICQGPVAEDLEGNIWIGTSGSFGNLNMYDGIDWKEVIETGSATHPQPFHSLAVDSNGIVWATVYSTHGGLFRISPDSIYKFDENNSILPPFVSNIIVDKDNNKWITSSNMLFKYKDVDWTSYTTEDFEYLNPRSIATDSEGNIWMGVGQQGMVMFDGENWIHYDDTFFGYNYPEVNKIIIDKDDNLWIDFSHATLEPKICKFDGENLTWYGENINLPDKERGLLGLEDNGNIWYGSKEGLALYNWEHWIFYNQENTRLLNNDVWDFFIDKHNNKWISAGCYLAKFNEDSLYIQHRNNPVVADNFNYLIFPNPVHNTLYIKPGKKNLNIVSAVIMDLTGKLIEKVDYLDPNAFQLNLGLINSGIYFIQIISNEEAETHKIIKY